MLNEEIAHLIDPLFYDPTGTVYEHPDGKFSARGVYRSFLVDPATGHCQCGRTGGCAHREAVEEYLAGNVRSCPLCDGRGMTATREDLAAIIAGATVESYFCRACRGEGVVTTRRRVALDAGMRRKGKAA